MQTYPIPFHSGIQHFPQWNTTFSTFFKYTGEQQQFVEKTNSVGEQVFETGKTEAYSWMDATISKSFFKKQFSATIGTRNIFNVTTLIPPPLMGVVLMEMVYKSQSDMADLIF